MTPSYYNCLADRGWRRSGTFYYKPDNKATCCPNYTIRLDADAFKPKKDQRKAANKWNRHVLGQDYRQKAARYCPKSRQETKRLKNTFDLRHTVHASEYDSVAKPLDPKSKEHIVPAHRFEVTLEPDNFTEEKYKLFQDYQQNVHKEGLNEISMGGFKRFLCSGLGQTQQKISDGKSKSRLLGSYHHCYRLDGKLIAMGVLDLLPNCVSSVYLMYHNDYASWDFGKLSALREIDLAREGGYAYYYMGFYIHTCVKMRYKANFKPTYMLDPISYEWNLLDADLQQRLSARTFVSMTLERALGVPVGSEDLRTFTEELVNASRPDLAIVNGNVKYKTKTDYVAGTKSAHSANSGDANIFQRGMPGAMPLEEVKKSLVLPKWKITQSSRIFELENLSCWYDDDIEDPGTIKGVMAELFACLGEDAVENTMVSFGS